MKGCFINRLFLVTFLITGVFAISPRMADAGTQCANPASISCDSDIDCLESNCPDCVVCNLTTNFCDPNDDFCENISGEPGESNDCRTAQCSDFGNFQNQSGCEYDAVASSETNDCKLCSLDTSPEEFSACGNGICERDEDEDCVNCALDCLVPGFEDQCPLTTGADITSACIQQPSVTFDGPPYNQPFSGTCEDGDLCTNNECGPNNDTCLVTPKVASGNGADFCCPAGAEPPAEDSSCPDLLGSNCDVDCRPIENCGTFPPGVLPVLEGSGIGCSLNPVAGVPMDIGVLTLAISMVFGLRFRRNSK